MVFLMYVWPLLWIGGLMFILAFPGFEMLKRGRTATQTGAMQ
jgi:hypothetical protein